MSAFHGLSHQDAYMCYQRSDVKFNVYSLIKICVLGYLIVSDAINFK